MKSVIQGRVLYVRNLRHEGVEDCSLLPIGVSDNVTSKDYIFLSYSQTLFCYDKPSILDLHSFIAALGE